MFWFNSNFMEIWTYQFCWWMNIKLNNGFQIIIVNWDDINLIWVVFRGSDITSIALQWTSCSSSLVLNGQSWETSWNRGSYINSITSDSMGVYDVNTWITWTSAWYEWVSVSSWLSWAKGKFLQYSSSGGVVGTWSIISGSGTTLNYFVKASYEETSGDGSYANPFGNIVKTISYARDQAANKGETTVNICKKK